MKNDLTELVLVLDRSGSMMSCQADMEQALLKLVTEQKEVEGECNVTFVRFDDEVEVVFQGKPIAEVGVEDIKLDPRRYTALYDGIGTAIDTVGKRLSQIDEANRPGLVLVVVVTDGGENASKKYTAQQINDMVKLQEDVYNWEFTYLGANQDSFAVAQAVGFAFGKISNYSVSNTSGMGSGVSCYVSNIRAAANRGDMAAVKMSAYSDEDRAKMA